METTTSMRWVRSKDGWIAGVCQGLSDSFGIETWILRLLWVMAFFCFGTGLFFYLLLAICLPRQDKLDQALQRRVLGVCSMLAIRYDFEVGLVRFLAVIFALSSFGLAVVAYVALYFFLPKEADHITASHAPRRY